MRFSLQSLGRIRTLSIDAMKKGAAMSLVIAVALGMSPLSSPITGLSPKVAEAATGGMVTATGSYTGNGTTGRVVTIPNISWTPQFVLIKSDGAEGFVMWFSGMPAGFTYDGTSLDAGTVTASGAGTFTLGSDSRTNGNGRQYSYTVFGSLDGTHVKAGSYVGDGVAGKNISLGGAWGSDVPTQVFVKRANFSKTVWKSSVHATNASQFLDAAPVTTNITALNAGGFTVSGATPVNDNGITYYYVALRDYADTFKTVQYTGDYVEGRLVNNLGFTPNAFAFVKLMAGSNYPALRFKDNPAGQGQLATQAVSTQGIQNFISGGIQISGGIYVNITGLQYNGFLVSERRSDIDYIVGNEVRVCGAVISQAGDYVLGADLTAGADETCIRIEADDVALDGNGYTITGSAGAKGVEIYEADATEITNMDISGFENGIYTYEATNALIEGNEISVTENGGVGIFMDFAVSFELKNNDIESAGNGVKVNEHVTLMGAKKITNNSIESDDWSLYLDSTGVEAVGNTLRSDKWVYNNAAGNTFDNGTSGNKYYFANGNGAWTQFDIEDSNNDNWADEGDDLPFGEEALSELYWFGSGEDAHPWTELDAAVPVSSSQSSPSATPAAPVAVSGTVYCTGDITTFCAKSSVPVVASAAACKPGDAFDSRTGMRCSSAGPAQTSEGQAGISSLGFTRNLSLGMTHPEVRLLQQYLNANGFAVASNGAGSAGNETQYFGPATRNALARFQKEKGIAPAIGYFGPVTRAFMAR